jgi:hypothetical protein
MEFDKLDIFLNQKGFEYYKSTNDNLGKAYHFSYKSNGSIVSYFSDWHYSDGTSYTSFQPQKKVFDRIKNEGLNLGMKFLGKEDTFDQKGYFLKYSYKSYKIEFWVSEATNNPNMTVYEINIE